MRLHFVLFAFFAACTTINNLNTNMETSNRLMSQNIVVMQESRARIQENTAEIKEATKATEDFKTILATNTSEVQGVNKQVKHLSSFVPAAFILLVFLLFLPSLLLFVLFRKLKFPKR